MRYSSITIVVMLQGACCKHTQACPTLGEIRLPANELTSYLERGQCDSISPGHESYVASHRPFAERLQGLVQDLVYLVSQACPCGH